VPQRAEDGQDLGRLLSRLGRGGDGDAVRAHRAQRAEVEVWRLLLLRWGLLGEHQVVVGQLETADPPGVQGFGRPELEFLPAARFRRHLPHGLPCGGDGRQGVGRHEHVR
jgi:hypothetical protein